MPIIVCGINHKTAPIALREQVTFPSDKIALYLNDLLTQENMNEAILLSTCNRSELYCVTENIEKAVDWFCRQHPLSREEILPLMYCYQDQMAIEHMMNVACGLDSMVLGESEILRQMKDAFAESCAASTVGTLFNRLFQEIFAVTKEIRTSTAIGACPVSVAHAAISFIKEKYSASLLDQATILLIGAGVTIDLAMRTLKSHSPKRVMIANRSQEKAISLAQQYQCEVICFTKLAEALTEADIVISATGSPAPIINKALLSTHHPLLIVDIAIPRDVEPSVSELDFIDLYCIDDLKATIQHNLRGREHAADKAREMIKQKSHHFMLWLNSLEKVATTIRAYRRQVEELCHVELSKAKKQLSRGDDPEHVLTSFSHALSNKLLHTPTVQLRQAGHEGRLELLQVAQELFAISDLESELL